MSQALILDAGYMSVNKTMKKCLPGRTQIPVHIEVQYLILVTLNGAKKHSDSFPKSLTNLVEN